MHLPRRRGRSRNRPHPQRRRLRARVNPPPPPRARPRTKARRRVVKARRPSSPGAPEMRSSTHNRDEATWEALGSRVVLRATDREALSSARASVESELDAIDLACSRFRADSELSYLNARAGRPTYLSPLLLEALEVALRAAALTDGDVDPTVGRALELAGYDRDWRPLPVPQSEPVLATVIVKAHSGWQTITLDRATSSIRIPKGVRLDLGATAKAWAADRAARAAAQGSDCGVLVSLGGDIATSGPAPSSGWRIRVTDDHRSDP